MDIFSYMQEQDDGRDSPLALRLRPESLDEMVGQQHILGKDKLLYRAIAADRLRSIILYGPPGTGKTSLAKVIAHTSSAAFRQINATVAGKKDMEEVVEKARQDKALYAKRTILFIDEIHRFNKAQQDYLLPFVEEGVVILIGATTENPYFEVNSALLSRSDIFELKPLVPEDIKILLKRAVEDKEKGLGSMDVVLEEDALNFLANSGSGDARSAIGALELGAMTTERSQDGKIHITLDIAAECIQRKPMSYDKDGDNHYDTISAFIKSMRGSDPDAVVYYLARMLAAGEDIKFIARRIMICASEDVGMADPQALMLATSASLAVERVGMPEARIILAHAAVYVACAPKSNASYMAIGEALRLVESGGIYPVPRHLQNVHADSAGQEREQGYLYAHDYPGHYVKQQYLPDELAGHSFYKPGELGDEKRIREYLKKIRNS